MSDLPRGLDPRRPYVCPRCGGPLVVEEAWRIAVTCPVDPTSGDVRRPIDALTLLVPPEPGSWCLESRLVCADSGCGKRPRRFYLDERENVGGQVIPRPHLAWTYGKPRELE